MARLWLRTGVTAGVWVATAGQERAAAGLLRIRGIAGRYARALTPLGGLLADGALIGPAGDRLAEGLVDRYWVMRSALGSSFDEVRQLAGPLGAGIDDPELGRAPQPARKLGAEVRGGDAALLDRLIGELGTAGQAWQDAGVELGTVLKGLGLPGGPGTRLRDAGVWVAGQAADVRQRRMWLMATGQAPGVKSGPVNDESGPGDSPLEKLRFGLDLYVNHYLPGLLTGLKDLGLFAAAYNPSTALPMAMHDFDGWVARTPVGIGQGLIYGAQHPVEFGKAITNWEMWKRDPARAAGEAVPNLMVTLLTFGSGAGASVGSRLGLVASMFGKVEQKTAVEVAPRLAGAAEKGMAKPPPSGDVPVAGGKAGAPKPPAEQGELPRQRVAEISEEIADLGMVFERYGAAVTGQVIGTRAAALGFGGRKASIIEQVAALGLPQREVVEIVNAAAVRAFNNTGGTLKLPNGDVAVLPTQPQVKDTFIVHPDGSVTARKTDRVVVDGKLELVFLD